jgi:cytochrome P450
MVPLHDPGFWSGDPYPTFARLRATDPVHRYEGEAGAMWAITRHADVSAISKDPATFCSGKGVLLTDLTNPVLSTDSIIYADPPLHAPKRKLVSPSLSVRRVGALEDRVRQLTVELLDAIDPAEDVDVVEALASPLPLLVIAELIGVPRSDMADFRRWSDAMIAAAGDRADPESLLLGAELFAYIADVVAARRADPRDDLVSILAHGEEGVLDDGEINMFVLTLLVAGNETTRSLISNGIDALATYPDQRRLMAADVTRAVEELLRWEPSIMSFCRTATRDTEVGGTPIAAGDHLVLCYQSANRDEAVFGATADQLDVTRDPNPHLSFGYAEHYCMGAGLARLEARVLFEELLARWPEWEVTGPLVRLRSRLARGVEHLPVRFAP